MRLRQLQVRVKFIQKEQLFDTPSCPEGKLSWIKHEVSSRENEWLHDLSLGFHLKKYQSDRAKITEFLGVDFFISFI